jgi:CRISPR-associated endonuclease Cas1
MGDPRGVCVAQGYGTYILVEHKQLVVRDGTGRAPRERLYGRATGRLRRLVVLGHSGSITFEAIRWLSDVGAGYVQIDADGTVLAAAGPLGTDRPSLRRAQAVALDTTAGNVLARWLVGEKIAGQRQTLGALPVPVAATTERAIDRAVVRLRTSVARDDIRLAEAQAAIAYWSAWSDVPLRLAKRDVARVPAHWLTFGSRSSPLTGGPRLAANPINALLSYLYAILEGEAALAARAVGLDPGLGVLHADQGYRPSLAADLMEPVRPVIDRWALELLARRTFAASDFFETRSGVCRLRPPLTHELAATCLDWRPEVGRVAEELAHRLEGDQLSCPMPTPVTGRARRTAHGGMLPRTASPRIRSVCAICGGTVPTGRATCSVACEREAAHLALEAFVAVGAAQLRKLRASEHGGMSDDGRARVGRRTEEVVRAAREWQRTHRWPNRERFAAEVLPGLEHMSPGALARSTGLSPSYCRRIKRGLVVPHPMWWEALAAASGSNPEIVPTLVG